MTAAAVIARYVEAERAYNAAPTAVNDPAEAAWLAALDELDACVPQTPDEFVRLFVARYDDDTAPSDEQWAILVARARRLVRRSAS